MTRHDSSALRSLTAGRRALLVASTGGHLAQMVRLESKLGVRSDSTFVTFDLPQRRSLLAGDSVEWIPYVGPRQYTAMAGSLPIASKLMTRHQPEVVFSTGAGVAVPFLLTAAARGIAAGYLESVSRILGPSATGKLMSVSPGVRTFTQHPHLETRRWAPGVSALDDFAVTDRASRGLPSALKVFVTLGTIAPFRFDRLVDRVVSLAHPDWELSWQVGVTARPDLPGRVATQLTSAAFDSEVQRADVVISHSGVGSAIRVLELGKTPVLVPREARFNEHVDDHQRQISEHLARRGLCQHADVDELGLRHVQQAFGRVVVPVPPVQSEPA